MSKNGKILVVVEPDNHPHEVVDRASWLAGLTDCDLHLVHCDLDVVAAVDPVHSYDKPADLDQLIVDNARAITEPTDGDVHLLHTYQRIVEIGTEATKTFNPIELPIDEFSKRIQTEHRERLDALAAANNIDADHTHQLPGSTRDLLPTFAGTHRADILVMGALAR